MLWIPITIAAAFLQNLRSALQKALKGRLSTTGAAYSRFVYALPLALLYLLVVSQMTGAATPAVSGRFLIYCLLGSLSQILFTVVLLWMFSFRSFAVGTTFSKLEIILIAILGAVLLGDTLGASGVAAVALGGLGAAVLSLRQTRLTPAGLIRGLGEKATLIGLLSAARLSASVGFFRGATLALGDDDFIMRAAFTLAVALTMQTAIMGGWFLAFDRAELARVFREWRRAAPAGVAGMACSACWFTAFALQNAAYVRALGQIELIFTFLATVFVFREPVARSEIAGVVLIAAAILVLLLGG